MSRLAFLLGSVKFVNFFDFFSDFVKYFDTDLAGALILQLLNATVSRILKEQMLKESGTQEDQSTIVVDKCTMIVRVCVDNPVFVARM